MEASKKGSTGARVFVGIVVLVILIFAFCFRVVGVGQVGIVTRFGKVNRESNSGVTFKLPFPVEHLTKMNIKTQKEQQDAVAATKDLQTVTTTVALNYNLTPSTARTVYQDVGTNYVSVVLDPTLQNSVKAVTADFNASDLIANRAAVEQKLDTLLVSKLGDQGITVTAVNIVNFNFSDQFDRAIEEKQVAEQNAQKAQYDLQTAQLNAQAQGVQAKTLTPEYLELQAIQKWNGKMPQAVSGGGNIFGINLQNTGN